MAVVSLWPGLVLTERLLQVPNLEQAFDISGAETPRFCGRAVAALAADAEVLRFTGRAVTARDLAGEYGFTDVDGRLPQGPLSHDERANAAGRTCADAATGSCEAASARFGGGGRRRDGQCRLARRCSRSRSRPKSPSKSRHTEWTWLPSFWMLSYSIRNVGPCTR